MIETIEPHKAAESAASRAPEVVLVTETDGFFGQRTKPWESMDTAKLLKALSQHFLVRQTNYAAIASGVVDVRNSIVIHGSSQQSEYKAFIDDVLLYLYAAGNSLVPSIHIVRSHENKGYQELYKRLRGIKAPPGQYGVKLSELNIETLKYPIVFKSISGFGSSGVKLIEKEDELKRAAHAEFLFSLGQIPKMVRSQLGYNVRKYLMRRRNLRPYGDYYRPLKRFVLQRFIPNLSFDFKVLVYQSRAFVLRRSVAENDFRASGSGKFVFEIPPPGLLDFARHLLLQFDEPYLSLDICFDGSDFHLLEFQGVHFGPYTLLNAPRHYVWDDSKWTIECSPVDLEDVTAESLILYLKRTHGRQLSSELVVSGIPARGCPEPT